MFDKIRQYREVIFFSLLFVVAVLVVANLWKYNLLSLRSLSANRDVIGSLSSMLTMLFLAAGAIFSYYTVGAKALATRAEVDINVSTFEAGEGTVMHAISVVVKNIGNAPIWGPRVNLYLKTHGPEDVLCEKEVVNWSKPSRSPGVGRLELIESGERLFFITHEIFSTRVWAVTYFAEVYPSSKTVRNVWRCIFTAENSCERRDRTAPREQKARNIDRSAKAARTPGARRAPNQGPEADS